MLQIHKLKVARTIRKVYRDPAKMTPAELAAAKYREDVEQNGILIPMVVYPINTLFYGEQAERLFEAGLAVMIEGEANDDHSSRDQTANANGPKLEGRQNLLEGLHSLDDKQNGE